MPTRSPSHTPHTYNGWAAASSITWARRVACAVSFARCCGMRERHSTLLSALKRSLIDLPLHGRVQPAYCSPPPEAGGNGVNTVPCGGCGFWLVPWVEAAFMVLGQYYCTSSVTMVLTVPQRDWGR